MPGPKQSPAFSQRVFALAPNNLRAPRRHLVDGPTIYGPKHMKSIFLLMLPFLSAAAYAYSALDYLIEKKLAKADEIYLMGYSNGGTTTLVSMTTQEADHPHHFAAAFAVAPGCSPSL